MALPGIYDSFQHWGEKHQTVWIYSDPHFNDDELAGGIKGRPSAEEQVKRINAKCGRRDCLIILGDVGDIEYVRQLRAEYKVLIMGNHDAGATRYKRETVKRVFDRDIHPDKAEIRSIMEQEFPGWNIRIEEEHDFHCPFERWIAYADNMLFDEVYEGALIVGEKLILTHEPVDIPWLFNVHGHIHDRRAKTDDKHLNVCSDVVGWEPINFNQFLKLGKTSKIQTIHRATIDKATARKTKRNSRSINTDKNR